MIKDFDSFNQMLNEYANQFDGLLAYIPKFLKNSDSKVLFIVSKPGVGINYNVSEAFPELSQLRDWPVAKLIKLPNGEYMTPSAPFYDEEDVADFEEFVGRFKGKLIIPITKEKYAKISNWFEERNWFDTYDMKW